MYFLFLEIYDREINYLIHNIEEAVYGEKSPYLAHLTIRGPYKNKINNMQINKILNTIKGDVLEIQGVNNFSNDEEEVVYLSVNSVNLRKVWWKPSYPIGQYGFYPHISVYRGKNKLLANALYRLLKNYNLTFLTTQFDIIEYESKRPKLLSAPLNEIIYTDHLYESGKLPSSFQEDVIMLRSMRNTLIT
jgi:hypothetical protein